MELLDLRKLTSGSLRPYRRLAAGEPIPAEGAILVDPARFAKERSILRATGRPVGLVVDGGTAAVDIAPFLGEIALLAIEFAKFSDGRGFSLATRIRRHHGFAGEIRALGALIPDHAEFLLRSGVTSVALADGLAVERFRKRLRLYSVWYQDAEDARPTALELRHGRTRRRLAS
ncbi:MAG: hypothetical protein Tsb008_02400 [Rhodothalassiaceae bacterium]